MRLKRQKSRQNLGIIGSFELLFLANVLIKTVSSITEYWTLQDPRVELPSQFNNYTYSNSVIQLEIYGRNESERLSLAISHTGTTLFDQILTLRARCSISKPQQDNNQSYYYECSSEFLDQLDKNTFSDRWAFPNDLHLRLQSGEKISSYESLLEGFYLKTKNEKNLFYKDFTFWYGTGAHTFANKTTEYDTERNYFPYVGLSLGLVG